MSGREFIGNETVAVSEHQSGTDLLRPLVEAQLTKMAQPASLAGVVIGELIGMTNEGRTPLVLYPGQPGSAALTARSVVNLYGSHIGSKVVLMLEGGEPGRPIVMGVLREGEGWPLAEQPGQVQVDSDGERLIVSAKEEVVLRCGKASITLTKAGKILIQGAYVLSRSSGVHRIKGSSVQIN